MTPKKVDSNEVNPKIVPFHIPPASGEKLPDLSEGQEKAPILKESGKVLILKRKRVRRRSAIRPISFAQLLLEAWERDNKKKRENGDR